MANSCIYAMHVKGRKEDIETFLKVMSDYDYDRHFWRVFSADVYREDDDEGGFSIYDIGGECAWSVYSCMMIGPGAYAHGEREEDTSLQLESERLNLEIEVFSEEQGMEFQEHFYYKNGEELANECVEVRCNYFDESQYEGGTFEEKFENFVNEWKEWGLREEVTIDNLDENGDVRIGGMENFMQFSF